jgi:hypothetical protein
MNTCDKTALLKLLQNPILKSDGILNRSSKVVVRTLPMSTILLVSIVALLTGAALGIHFNGVA